MNCSEFLAHISEFLDGELSSREADLFRLHLDHCVECRHEVQIMIKSSKTLYEHLPILEPSPEIWWAIYKEIQLQNDSPHSTWFRMPKFLCAAIVALVLLTGVAVVHYYQKISLVSPKQMLQSELNSYVKQRNEIIKKGSPFETSDPLQKIKDKGNPFSPFVESLPKDPFKELQ